MENHKDLLKEIALIEELQGSIKLIELGLGELQNLDKNENYYFLPFQLLSQGFERFMKCYICMAHYEIHKVYPTNSYMKNDLGHDLSRLLREICDKHFDEDIHHICINDFLFLLDDVELKELMEILAEFGQKARYYNFDLITGQNVKKLSSEDRWKEFKSELIFSKLNNFDKILDWDLGHEVHREIVRYVVIIFEKFVSALSRQMLYGGIGEKAKVNSSIVFDFALIFPDKLGNRDYRNQTTRFKELPKKIHKRTFFDYLQRKFNPKFKSKVIKKGDFDGDWPFYVDEVVVECRYSHWCIVTIEGYDYALNGAAKGRFKLENPHDAGRAIIGKSIGCFIDIARKL